MAALKLIIFDWEGTLVDRACQGAVEGLLEVFARYRLMLTTPQVRATLGLPRYEQVRSLLESPAVGQQFVLVHGRRWNEADVLDVQHDLAAIHEASLARHCQLLPEVAPCLAELRQRGLAIGTTLDESRALAEQLWDAARLQGFESDADLCSDDVPAGRPAPWMIFRLMERLDAFPPRAAVKVGDTPTDIDEGRNAGCWCVGLASPAGEDGPPLVASPQQRLRAAGAHEVIASLAELPAALSRIEARLLAGEQP